MPALAQVGAPWPRPVHTEETAQHPHGPPVKARGGRPAGLFTWVAVGLVVIVVAALVIIKVASGGTAKSNGVVEFHPHQRGEPDRPHHGARVGL